MEDKIFTPDILEFLFSEFEEEVEDGYSFDEWVNRVGYLDTWTDEQIYNHLPVFLQALCQDDVMNFSWWQGPI